MTFIPSPGIILIEPVASEASTKVIVQGKNTSKLQSGRVIAVGRNLITDFNSLIETNWYAKVGDTIYFLSYDGNYDDVKIDGKLYYMVKVQDCRMTVK